MRWGTRARRRLRASALAGLAVVVVLALGVAVIEADVWAAARGAVYTRVADAPRERVALVFGAGLAPGGGPSPALARRVEAAAALYRAGKVERLLLSGDNGSVGHNEPAAMRAYALELGVPDGAIVSDYAGFRTYDSCYRARAIFGVQEAVLVTQAYHLPRAIYTCRGLGVRAVGFAAADFSGPAYTAGRWREYPARLVAWWQVTVTRPRPRFLGPRETALAAPAAP